MGHICVFGQAGVPEALRGEVWQRLSGARHRHTASSLIVFTSQLSSAVVDLDPLGSSMIWPVLRIRIRDPGSGAFLTPVSGIRNRFSPDPGSRISDPGSQTHIFESLPVVTTFGPTFFLKQFKNKIILKFVKFVATKKVLPQIFFHPSLFCSCFWIRDPGWVKIRIRVPKYTFRIRNTGFG